MLLSVQGDPPAPGRRLLVSAYYPWAPPVSSAKQGLSGVVAASQLKSYGPREKFGEQVELSRLRITAPLPIRFSPRPR